MSIANSNKVQSAMPKIPTTSSLDYLYQAISLIEHKSPGQQQFQQVIPPPSALSSSSTNMSDYASNLINESKKRIIGNLIYQNQQQQLQTPQEILSNNENFSLANLANYNNKINPNYTNSISSKVMPSCTCCTLNQAYTHHQYYYPPVVHKQVKPSKKEDKRINTLINNRQMHLKDVESHKVASPPSRLEKAKQFARKAEFQSSASASPVYSSNSSSPVQQYVNNQYYPVDVLYTLLPMYLNPYLNKQNMQNAPQPQPQPQPQTHQHQQPIDSAYIQSLVNFFLNMQQQAQFKHPSYPHNNNTNMPVYTQKMAQNTPSVPVSPISTSSNCSKSSLKTSKAKLGHLDVSSKVDEHFKRSLGNEYFNYVSPSKRIKLDTENISESEHYKNCENILPESPCCSVKSISSCSSPVLNINEMSSHSIMSDNSDEIKSPDYVDCHFSKALGVDMWNKLKEQIKIDTDVSSDMLSSSSLSSISSMSESSLSPVKL